MPDDPMAECFALEHVQNSVMRAFPPVTELLHAARAGDAQAWNALFNVTYPQLRTLAHARLRAGRRDANLDTTSLVHEAYIRLSRLHCLPVESTRHFVRYVARTMRTIIVDIAREHLTQRRGNGVTHVTLNTSVQSSDGDDGAAEIVGIHEALATLAHCDERLVTVVEMRYFAGMSDKDIADALDVTDRTIRRDWEKAKILLRDALRHRGEESPADDRG